MTDQTDRQQLYSLTEADVRQYVGSDTLSTAERYLRRGKVVEASVEGANLFALVEESAYKSHAVEISIEDGDLYAACTCPYGDEPACCEHTSAVLLAWVRHRRQRDRTRAMIFNEREFFTVEAERPRTGDDLSEIPAPVPGIPGDGAEDREQDAAGPGLFTMAPDFEAEFRTVLARQTINELRTIAKNRGIQIKGNRKDPIVEELAAQLSNLESIRVQILDLDDKRQELLTYLHLTLLPGYGVSVENIVDGLIKRHGTTRRSALHNQIVSLGQRGLLLALKQRNLTYYSLPQAVRACLPPRPTLVPAYPAKRIDRLQVRARSASTLIQMLYTIWTFITEQHPKRRAAPPRQPVEEQWPQFQGWDHVPSEIQELTKRRRNYYSLFNQAITIPTPTYHFRSADRRVLREKMGLPAERPPSGATDFRPRAAKVPVRSLCRRRTLREELVGRTGDEQAEFCYALLEGLGAISAEPGAPVQSNEKVFQELLRLPPSARAHIVLVAWTTSTTWSEMDVVLRSSNDIRLRRNLTYTTYKPENLYEEWRAGRQVVFRFLSVLEENRWVSVDGFLRVVFDINPNLMHSHADRSVWWIESLKTRRQFGTTFEDWQESCGRFVLATLEGPLAWLGAVSLGYRDGKLAAFKLTPVGSFALQRRSSLVEAEPEATPTDVAERPPSGACGSPCAISVSPSHLTGGDSKIACAISVSPQAISLSPMDFRRTGVEMQGDLTIALVPDRAPTQLHDLLHLLGKLQEASPERFVYRITADGVLRALEQGQTIEMLIASLNQSLASAGCGKDIPTAWQDKLHAWSQNYGKLHVYEDITLIELADDYALQELMINTSLREHLIYQFSPRLVVIQPAAVDILVREMKKRGYTPRVTQGPDTESSRR